MTRRMDKEHILMLTALTIMEIGSMIDNTVSEWNPGQMVLNTRVLMLMVRKRVKENSLLLMAVIMKANSNRMKSADSVSIIGQTANNTKAPGTKIRCMEKEHLYGKIRKNIRVNSSMTSVRVPEHSVGPMVDNMLESGRLVSSMVMVLTLVLKVRRNQVSGKMARR